MPATAVVAENRPSSTEWTWRKKWHQLVLAVVSENFPTGYRSSVRIPHPKLDAGIPILTQRTIVQHPKIGWFWMTSRVDP